MPPASKRAPQRRGGREQRVAVLAQRLLAQLADLLRLHQHRARGRRRAPRRGRSRTPRGTGRGSSRRRCRGPARASRPLEQAAVVEEHVDQLPEHVVERLDQLLAHERVVARRLELPLGAGARRSAIVRQPRAARPRAQRRVRSRASGSSAPKAIAMSSGSASSVDLRRERPALAREPDRRQRPLADDHRVDELDRDVAGVRARRRRVRRARPAARRARSARPSRGSSARAAPPRPRRTRDWPPSARRELVDAERPRSSLVAVATGSPRLGSGRRRRPVRAPPPSHSRHSSTPSPVRALVSIVSRPGLTASMLARKPVEVEVEVRRAGRSC